MEYLARLSKHIFRPTVLVVDALQILSSVVLPLLYRMMGWPMSEATGWEAAAYIGYAAVTLFFIRTLFASYWTWKEDQAIIADLRRQLDSPDHESRNQTITYITGLKHKVAQELSAHVEMALRRDDGVRSKVENDAYMGRQEYIKSAAIQLSQNQDLHDDLLKAINLVDCVTADKLERIQNSEDRTELKALTKSLVARLLKG